MFRKARYKPSMDKLYFLQLGIWKLSRNQGFRFPWWQGDRDVLISLDLAHTPL